MRAPSFFFALLATLASAATLQSNATSFLSTPLFGQIGIPTIPFPKIPELPKIPEPPAIPQPPSPPPHPFETKAWQRVTGVKNPTYQEFEQARQEEPEQETLEETIAKLLDEFGSNARFGVTEHFIFIYDTTNYFAQWVALICERVETTYEKYVRYMGIGQTELDEPMVVLIFTNKQDYEAYATKNFTEYASLKNKPIGFYSSAKNRIALYDLTESDKTKVEDFTQKRTLEEVATEILSQPKGMETLSVIVHETTHMVSYNRGMFGRTSKNPTWALEGLAMLFEAPVGEIKDGGWNVTYDFEANRARIREFQQYAKSTTENALRRVITSETINGDVPGSYEISWALFSYLYKKYPRRLARYLYATAGMQPRESYPVNERAAEFEECFTSDYDKLYKELCAFVDELEKNPELFMAAPPQEEKKGKNAENGKKEGEKKGEEQADKSDDANKEDAKQDEPNKESASGKDAEKTAEKEDKQREDPQSKSVDKPKEPSKSVVSEPKKQDAPTIVLEGVALDGSVFNWSKYSGKYVLVCFWASWNKASAEEISRLVALYDKYHNAGLEIVGYSLDDDVDTLKKFVADYNVQWTTLSQSLSTAKKYEDMADRYNAYSLPKTTLVGKDGKALETNVRGAELEEKLKELFPEQ